MLIKTIGVVGAGQMGSGIAQVAATAGYSCIISDTDAKALKRGAQTVENSLGKLVAKGLIDDKKAILERMAWVENLGSLSSCDLVIEAVVEQERVKIDVLQAVDKILPAAALLASNTSSIPITRLASATRRPAQFMGMHFMNPVPLMKLVELIRGHQTSDHTVELIQNVAQRMGKTATLAKDFPGFITNRILLPMINEAFFALMEGVGRASDIDQSMKLGCNWPMGPLELADFVGLDTCLFIAEVMHEGLGDKYRPCPLLRQYVEAGLLGRKSGQGVYKYDRT